MSSALVLNFRASLTPLEKFSLYLLWSIVFGPESIVMREGPKIFHTFFFFGKQIDLEKMAKVITDKSWYDDEFLAHRQTPQVCEAMEYLNVQGNGFDQQWHTVLEKMISVKVVPLKTPRLPRIIQE